MFARLNSITSAIRRRFSFVIHGNVGSSASSASAAVDDSAVSYVPFADLSRQEQYVVTRYLISVAELLSLLQCMQSRGRAVDHPEVLSNFAICEAEYVKAGFMPFIPGALKASGLSSLEPRSIDQSRLVRRRTGDNYVCFAVAMRQQVERSLRTCSIQQLDSRSVEERLKELYAASDAERSNRKE